MQPRIFFLSAGAALLAAGLPALAQTPGETAPAAIRDSLNVQKARGEHVAGRGKRAYYTTKFDLSDLPPYAPGPQVSGNIRMWGLNYLKDGLLADYWEAGFQKFHPGVTFEYHLTTAYTAASGLVAGLADLGPCRKFTFGETEEFERVFNYHPTEITFATGSYNVPGWNNAFGIFVNRANPIAQLTIAQLDGIFGSVRDGGWVGTEWHPEFARGADKNIRTWGQLGLTGEWADKPIHVYGLNLRYHQSTTISDWLLMSSDKWNENLRTYANYARPDGTLAIAAELLMEDLSKDPYGIAYSGIQNLTAGTKALAIAPRDGGQYVEMNMANIQNRTYPLADAVYFYLNRKPGTPVDPKVREFLRYVLSREGQEEVERDGKYLPLTAAVVREQLRKLE
jgi:phosphate transport system substrate-binding protein